MLAGGHRTLPPLRVGKPPESTFLRNGGLATLNAALKNWEIKQDIPQAIPWRKQIAREHEVFTAMKPIRRGNHDTP